MYENTLLTILNSRSKDVNRTFNGNMKSHTFAPWTTDRSEVERIRSNVKMGGLIHKFIYTL